MARKGMRTRKGNVTAKARKKHGMKGSGKFPIFDRRSATSALRLRGHAKGKARKNIIARAARYAPAAAKRARKVDRKR